MEYWNDGILEYWEKKRLEEWVKEMGFVLCFF